MALSCKTALAAVTHKKYTTPMGIVGIEDWQRQTVSLGIAKTNVFTSSQIEFNRLLIDSGAPLIILIFFMYLRLRLIKNVEYSKSANMD